MLKTSTEALAANPACIQSSLTEWAKQLGYDTLETAPLFLDISFFNIAINRVAHAGIGFDEILKFTCEQLPCTRTPGRVQTFVTNYPWLGPELTLNEINRDNIFERAQNSSLFQKYLPQWQENLQQLFNDGGVDYMLSRISESLDTEHRRRQIRQLIDRDLQRIRSLVQSILPTPRDMEIEQKRAAIQRIIEQLEQCGNSRETLQKSCSLIKEIMYVDMNVLEPLPAGVANGNNQIFNEYVTRQLSLWRENKLTQFTNNNANLEMIFGNENRDETFRLFLQTLIESCDNRSLVEWTSQSFQHIQSDQEARRARTLMALAISNALWTGRCIRPREIRTLTPAESMRQYHHDDGPEHSILNLQILRPFISHCIQIRDGEIRHTKRGEQIGDQELQRLLENCQP